MEQDNNEFIKTPNALYYSHMDSFEKSYECLRKHPQLISDEVADELLAEAFSAQMDHRPHRSEQLIRQALVLQYIVQVGKHKMPLFFEKMSSPQGQARRAFADDVAFKYNHVKTRCLAIAKERKEEAARQQQQATIIEQKRAEMDMETEEASQQAMVIQVPEDADENGRKRAEAFNSFPPKFQRALLGNELDKVNEALQELESDEQERILQLCRETGLLDIAEEEELID
jgi:cell division cycle protein 37